jgi:hypothetical protein
VVERRQDELVIALGRRGTVVRRKSIFDDCFLSLSLLDFSIMRMIKVATAKVIERQGKGSKRSWVIYIPGSSRRKSYANENELKREFAWSRYV